jgi:tetratricopeptide (TPR) repeat protein
VADLCEGSLRDPRRAIQHLRRAAELLPDDATAYERLAALYVKARDYSHAIDAYRRLSEAMTDVSARARCEIRVGCLYRDVVGDAAAARRAFEGALKLDPLSVEAALELAALLGRPADEPARRALLLKTLAALRASLTDNPLQPERMAALCRVAERTGGAESIYQAAELAVFFNIATPADEEFFASHRTGRPAEPVRELTTEGRERLVASTLGGAWRDAWLLAADAADRLHGPSPATFGVGRGERVPDRPGGPFELVFRAARALGVQLEEIYLAKGDADLCVAMGVQAPALILGGALQGTPPPRARYRIGCALAWLGQRAAPLASLQEAEARLLLASIAHLVGVPAPRALGGPGVDDRARKLDKALGRKERKQLATLAPRLIDAGDPAAFVRALAATAARAGALLAGDLAAALEEARPGLEPAGTRRFKPPADLVADLEGFPEALEVLRFAASDDLLALRRELGWM